jgi:hypothetical protein
MNSKTFSRVEIKSEDKGEVTALFSTLSVKDSDGDVTVPGAFEDGANVVISAYGHTSWSGALPVGAGKIRTTKTEAILDGQFFLDTKAGADTFVTVKELARRGLGEWSYGYDAVKYSFGEHEGERVRFLEQLKVHEVSPVLLGAGVNTRTLAAKSGMRFGDEGAAVVAAVEAFAERAADVVAMRREKGKELGPESRQVAERLEEALKRLRAVLDEPGDDGQVDEQAAAQQAAALQQEFLRFTARRLAG